MSEDLFSFLFFLFLSIRKRVQSSRSKFFLLDPSIDSYRPGPPPPLPAEVSDNPKMTIASLYLLILAPRDNGDLRSVVPLNGVYGTSGSQPFNSLSLIFFLELVSQEYQMTTNTYAKLRHPTPSLVHANYSFYTPGGADRRWVGRPETEESMHWVGGLMYVSSLFYHNN